MDEWIDRQILTFDKQIFGCGSKPRKPLMNIKIGGTWVFIRPKMRSAWVLTHCHLDDGYLHALIKSYVDPRINKPLFMNRGMSLGLVGNRHF